MDQSQESSTGDQLILVDEQDCPKGAAGKLAVHNLGLLHRAFSIFLLDAGGRLLIQRRDARKYHSGGMWANTCCGHPLVGERTTEAAQRRLGEELGLQADLTLRLQSRYSAPVAPDMHENEFVHVLFGRLSGEPRPNPEEVSDIELVSLNVLVERSERNPSSLAVWLRHYLAKHRSQLSSAIEQTLRA